jgi:fatty acid desaturase
MKRSDESATRDTLIWLGSMVALAGLGVATWGTWWCMPFFAARHHVWTRLTQHAGLAEDTLDHRLNSRTVYMNPVSRGRWHRSGEWHHG